MIYDTVVIGSGQAGLAAGYYLKQAGLSFVILEAGDAPGGSWPKYYDSLTLNSPARYSSLPGLPFPGAPDRYPVRDEVAAYLRAYAAHVRLPIVTGTRVQRVERSGGYFHVLTSANDCYIARAVVAATGSFGSPYRPSIAGLDEYRGQVLHVAEYRRPAPFRGQRIVIVGGGNGAVRVGAELAAVARVTLATRGPIRYQPQRVLGHDIHFWLQLIGLDQQGWLGNRSVPVYADRADRVAPGAARLERQPMFRRFGVDGVIWPDGSQETIDTVLFATGYRPHLAYLSGIGALDDNGRVFQERGRSTTVPGLYYVGLVGQRSIASATLRGVGPDAPIVVDHLRGYRQAASSAPAAWRGIAFQAPRSPELALIPVAVLGNRYTAVNRY